MSDDDETVLDRLWDMAIGNRFASLVPLWIARRPDSLMIMDYRPTFVMFLTAAGFVIFTVLFGFALLRFDDADSLALWATGIPAVGCLAFTFRGTIREEYYFDRSTETYTFIRRFIHRREIIEGSISQFKGAHVKTTRNEDSEAYYVVLEQEGMFLTGVGEQFLRDEVPIFNSFDRESRIASAISKFLLSQRSVPDNMIGAA